MHRNGPIVCPGWVPGPGLFSETRGLIQSQVQRPAGENGTGPTTKPEEALLPADSMFTPPPPRAPRASQ